MSGVLRSIWAVTLGVLVTTILGTLLGALVGVLAWSVGHATPSNVGQLMTSPLILAASMGIGLLATVLGGYQAGKTAQHAEILHAAITGVVLAGLSVGFTLLSMRSGAPAQATWYVVASNAMTIPAAVAGGVLARWRFGGGVVSAAEE